MEVAPKFRDQATCISCHHNALPALAAAAARRKGIEVDEARARKNLEDIRTFFTSAVPRMMLGDPAVGGEAITTGYGRDGAAGRRPSARHDDGSHDALADGSTDAGWTVARQRAQSAAVRVQPHQPHGDRRRRAEVISASRPQKRDRGQPATGTRMAARRRTRSPRRNEACASWVWSGPMRRALA